MHSVEKLKKKKMLENLRKPDSVTYPDGQDDAYYAKMDATMDKMISEDDLVNAKKYVEAAGGLVGDGGFFAKDSTESEGDVSFELKEPGDGREPYFDETRENYSQEMAPSELYEYKKPDEEEYILNTWDRKGRVTKNRE